MALDTFTSKGSLRMAGFAAALASVLGATSASAADAQKYQLKCDASHGGMCTFDGAALPQIGVENEKITVVWPKEFMAIAPIVRKDVIVSLMCKNVGAILDGSLTVEDSIAAQSGEAMPTTIDVDRQIGRGDGQKIKARLKNQACTGVYVDLNNPARTEATPTIKLSGWEFTS